MGKLKKALAASALAIALATPAGVNGFAVDTSCSPALPEIFAFTIGLTGGTVTVTSETGSNGNCTGTFSAVVGGTSFSGTFAAIHFDSSVLVTFQSNVPGLASGTVYYNSAQNFGVAAIQTTLFGGCQVIVGAFTRNLLTGSFVPIYVASSSCSSDN